MFFLSLVRIPFFIAHKLSQSLSREKTLDIGRCPLHHISFPCSSGSSLQDSLPCRQLQELDCTYFLLLMFCVCLGHCKSFLCNHFNLHKPAHLIYMQLILCVNCIFSFKSYMLSSDPIRIFVRPRASLYKLRLQSVILILLCNSPSSVI